MDVADGDDTQRTGLVKQITHPTAQPRSPVHTPADLREHTRTSFSIPKMRRFTGSAFYACQVGTGTSRCQDCVTYAVTKPIDR